MAEQTFHHRHRYHRFVMVVEEEWAWEMGNSLGCSHVGGAAFAKSNL